MGLDEQRIGSDYFTSDEVIKNAEPLLQKALSLNPNLVIAHVRIAEMYLWYKWILREYRTI
jgi:hypothetical protein